MMAIKISNKDLQIIFGCLTSIKDDEFTKSLDDFLREQKDDYCFYGRMPDNVKTIQITIEQLERIPSFVESGQCESVHENLNRVCQFAIATSQESIFLYGRMKNE